MAPSLQVIGPKYCTCFLSPYAGYKPRPPYLPLFDHLNDIMGRVTIMKLRCIAEDISNNLSSWYNNHVLVIETTCVTVAFH